MRVHVAVWWLAQWTLVLVSLLQTAAGLNKRELKEQALEMFRHAYWSYMKYAYPADELMPLSCKGRTRGVTPCRGDVDDALGNFSLTLIDTLDTLVVVGEYTEFERATSLIINNVQFDSDLVVSVFETNIRVVGGLLGGHFMAKTLQARQPHRMPWYTDQLLLLAKDIATRLLPAFNTTSGLPYPRINLKHGMVDALKRSSDTCTACGGTMILEFAALSRLTGDPIFEEKAHKAMDFLWTQRHRGSDLMGTVLNIQNGDWIRRDSGVGAGIDSYYEYCLKAYVLLGDEAYLHRFNTHYDAIMRYVSQGPVFVDVHMHKPTVASRSFMDSLLAFWPGLQVLKGDLKPAIETHEMLYQVIQKHNFLPEGFTHDFQVHWGQHPLRPEFVESTYFLYRATQDEHYLEVGAKVMEALNTHVRVPCGFTAIKDVRTMAHEDRMDSFVLAETFKYLYMLYAEKEDLIFDPENFIFTTEAHLLPLSLATTPLTDFKVPGSLYTEDRTREPRSCINTRLLFKGELSSYARLLRSRMKNLVVRSAGGSTCRRTERKEEALEAKDFSAANPKHLEALKRMGISMESEADGRVQLVHSAAAAASPQDAEQGLVFMQEMIELSRKQEQEVPHASRVLQILSAPYVGDPIFTASPAQFGPDLTGRLFGVEGGVVVSEPLRACSPLENAKETTGKIALVERSDCMFIEKAIHAEAAGAIGVIVIDHLDGTESDSSPLFAMSGDGEREVGIPAVFLFRKEGEALLRLMGKDPGLVLRIGEKPINPDLLYSRYIRQPWIYDPEPFCHVPKVVRDQMIVKAEEDGAACVYRSEYDRDPLCFHPDGKIKEARGPRPEKMEFEVVDSETFIVKYADGKVCTKEGSETTCVHPEAEGLSANLAKTTDKLTPTDKEGRAEPEIIQVNILPNGQKQLKLNFEQFFRSEEEEESLSAEPPQAEPKLKKKMSIDEMSSRAEELLKQLEKESNIAQLRNAQNYYKVIKKLAFMAAGDPLPMTKEDEVILGELAYAVKPSDLVQSSENAEETDMGEPSDRVTNKPNDMGPESDSKTTSSTLKPPTTQDGPGIIEVYHDDDVTCAMNEKEGKLDCERNSPKDKEDPSVEPNPHSTLQPPILTHSPPKLDSNGPDSANVDHHVEGGIKCFYENSKGTIRCVPEDEYESAVQEKKETP